MTNKIMVFGSNLRGAHGAGSALEAAQNHGAQYGIGVGRTGQSYAIPTKDRRIVSMTVEQIEPYVKEFIQYAKEHPELDFNVVKIGCGLAGFTNEEMAPLFRDCLHLRNVFLHPDWLRILRPEGSSTSHVSSTEALSN